MPAFRLPYRLRTMRKTRWWPERRDGILKRNVCLLQGSLPLLVLAQTNVRSHRFTHSSVDPVPFASAATVAPDRRRASSWRTAADQFHQFIVAFNVVAGLFLDEGNRAGRLQDAAFNVLE